MFVHHTGIIVKDIEKSIELYKKLRYVRLSDIIIDTVQSNKVIFLNISDGMQTIELIEPIDEKSSIYNFKAGYHHICYDVSEFPNFIGYFKSLRVGKIFTQPIIAPAIDNREVAFALLNNGAFVEFILSR